MELTTSSIYCQIHGVVKFIRVFFHWNFLSCYRVWNFYWCTYKRDKYLWGKNCAQFKVFSEMWWWFHGHPSLKLHHILLNKKYRNTQSFFHECRMWRAGIFGPHCCLKPLFLNDYSTLINQHPFLVDATNLIGCQ